jgi:hypothetical protein
MNTCLCCETLARRDNGDEVTRTELNRAHLWGCTCDLTADEVADLADEFWRQHG